MRRVTSAELVLAIEKVQGMNWLVNELRGLKRVAWCKSGELVVDAMEGGKSVVGAAVFVICRGKKCTMDDAFTGASKTEDGGTETRLLMIRLPYQLLFVG